MGRCRGSVPPSRKGRYNMTFGLHFPVIAGLALATSAFCTETPICEEFSGESNVECVSNDSIAVITSRSPSGRTYEFYNGNRKAYLEVSADGSIYASTGVRKLSLPSIPTDSTERYVSDLLDAILDEIAWK